MLMERFDKMLAALKGWILSLGGYLTLANVMLPSLPTFVNIYLDNYP